MSAKACRRKRRPRCVEVRSLLSPLLTARWQVRVLTSYSRRVRASTREGSMSKFNPLFAFLPLCVACGGAFQPSAEGSGGAGQSGGASNISGGDTGAAAGDSGTGANGGASSAGAPSGGTSSGGTHSGGRSSGGSPSGGSPSGGSPSGGSPSGGAGGGIAGGATAGAAGAPATDCSTLRSQYSGLLEKARGCDPIAKGQCSPNSKLPAVNGCGCGVLVNSQSEYTTLATKKHEEGAAAGCYKPGPCPLIACLDPTGASCSVQGMGMTNVCTATFAATN